MQFGFGNRADTFIPFDTTTYPIIHEAFFISFCPVQAEIATQIFPTKAVGLTTAYVVAKLQQFLFHFRSSLLCSRLTLYL